MMTYASVTEFKAWNRERIITLSTPDLWAIVRSTNPLTERFASELSWAKGELRRRGEDTVGL